MKTCQARQYSDQMICGRCALEWDINDPDPPACLTRIEYGSKIIKELRHELNRSKNDASRRENT
jgi:hypothetical protein